MAFSDVEQQQPIAHAEVAATTKSLRNPLVVALCLATAAAVCLAAAAIPQHTKNTSVRRLEEGVGNMDFSDGSVYEGEWASASPSKSTTAQARSLSYNNQGTFNSVFDNDKPTPTVFAEFLATSSKKLDAKPVLNLVDNKTRELNLILHEVEIDVEVMKVKDLLCEGTHTHGLRVIIRGDAKRVHETTNKIFETEMEVAVILKYVLGADVVLQLRSAASTLRSCGVSRDWSSNVYREEFTEADPNMNDLVSEWHQYLDEREFDEEGGEE